MKVKCIVKCDENITTGKVYEVVDVIPSKETNGLDNNILAIEDDLGTTCWLYKYELENFFEIIE